jgi:group I intron endonuclease
MVQVSDYPEWEESGIYTITNQVNGKEYVGKSKELTRRNRDELSELKRGAFHNKHLQRSYYKYGPENFEIEVIKRNICPGLLGVYEIFEIAKRNTDDPEIGYNKTLGGDGGPRTEETRKKQSEITKKSWENDPERRLKQSERMTGINSPWYGLEPWNKGIKRPEITGKKHGRYNHVVDNSKQEILFIYYNTDFTLEEIADLFECSEPTIRTRIQDWC